MYMLLWWLPTPVAKDNSKRPASGEPDRSAASDGTGVWTVSDPMDDCDHPPEAVEYVGDDGRNLYFHCNRCDGAIIAEGAVHLLA